MWRILIGWVMVGLGGVVFAAGAVEGWRTQSAVHTVVPLKDEFLRDNILWDCGPLSLYVLARSDGVECDYGWLCKVSSLSGAGVSLANLQEAALTMGYQVTGHRANYSFLYKAVAQGAKAIVHVDGNHFVAILSAVENRRLICFDSKFGIIVASESTISERDFGDRSLLLLKKG